MSEKTGYIHGSDLLVFVGEKALGHSKTCTITNTAETKERATKEISNSGYWTEKAVSRLTVSVSAEGFVFYGTNEMGYEKLLEMWESAKPVTLKYAYRGEETTTYRQGDFIITSLEQVAPAEDDATYTISFENSGEVKSYPALPQG